ncbi:unnamed protein product [marine sediment metagenome]|uniref:Uncharacterized protein n=1 Tax=marine sediment metagenome TaxID=412755 RepID=X1B752_9ZZZZ
METKLVKLLEQMRIGGQHDALLVLENHKTGKKRHIWGRNIVTNDGDLWYAESACGEVVTIDHDSLYLATANDEGGGAPTKTSTYGNFTVHAGSEKHVTVAYPQTNDADGDNTGSGVDIVSWKFEYTTGDGPFVAITHSFISSLRL